MPTRKRSQTRKQAATAAAKVLRNPKAKADTKSAAASALSQTGRRATTGRKAASAAGKALARKSTLPRGKKAAASALAQTPRKRKG
ncbi:MAG: hypothetical protein ABI877_01050 [Gemmatimonadaceae bacterium]